ncbi:nucleoside hydrolase [Novosphingobium clariflavum]|uniref:Nucleoside hydrolase n=1 Tax=Novosphingobium clariflavum TaxID=2029884 RepID=A0ABV6S7R9_9SPHN|nr:nucleoside hydrolase [Novosphingobium clariflavum]
MLDRVDRRAFIVGAAGAALAAIPGAALGDLRREPAARVIVDNDFAGDPDGLIALAHQAASRSSRCVLVTSSTLDRRFAGMGGLDPDSTAEQGASLARDLLARMGLARMCPVLAGSESLGPEPRGALQAARAIVAEAMRDDPLPLFFACGGPLTNLAQALRLEPRIAARMTLVWLGGDGYPGGGEEYNLSADLAAARDVIERSGIALWQIPMPTYAQCQISIADFERNVRDISATTQWLYERYAKLPPFVKLGGTIGCGDSALVLLTAISAATSRTRTQTARRILDDARYGDEIPGRTIRVIEELDVRLLLSDFVAAMRAPA